MRTALRVWTARADLVEPDACGFDRIERLFLQLDGSRSLGRAGEGAAGDGAMVSALRVLQGLERGGVLALPLEPGSQVRDRVGLARTGAFDAEQIAGVLALRVREPVAGALHRN